MTCNSSARVRGVSNGDLFFDTPLQRAAMPKTAALSGRQRPGAGAANSGCAAGNRFAGRAFHQQNKRNSEVKI